jgi:hypothetical protein
VVLNQTSDLQSLGILAEQGLDYLQVAGQQVRPDLTIYHIIAFSCRSGTRNQLVGDAAHGRHDNDSAAGWFAVVPAGLTGDDIGHRCKSRRTAY